MKSASSSIFFVFVLASCTVLAAIAYQTTKQTSVQAGSIERPEASFIEPISFQEPRMIFLSEVKVVGVWRKATVLVQEKTERCKPWRESNWGGFVRECENN